MLSDSEMVFILQMPFLPSFTFGAFRPFGLKRKNCSFISYVDHGIAAECPWQVSSTCSITQGQPRLEGSPQKVEGRCKCGGKVWRRVQ